MTKEEFSTKKIIETISINDYEVLTDTGFVDIVSLHKTIPYNVYEIDVNGVKLKCADNHIVFDENLNEIFVRDLNIGDKIIIKDGIGVVLNINDLGYEEEMYDLELIEESNHRYFTNNILSHNTHLAKNLSLLLFGSEKNMIRLDMSEYMEKHTVSKLIGSPPGYVGYEEGGMLTEKVKNNPFSVILLDEIEKAHPDVRNILLQVLEDGRLSDSLGKTINFTNTVIIMTSNVGAKKVNDFGNGVGFKTSQSAFIDIENKKGIIKTELKKVFSPEFLNRIDDIVIFNKLTKDNLKEITKIQLALLSKRLTEQNLIVSFDDSIVTKILDITNEENYGARPIKRNIQYLIENYLATQILLKNKLLEKACTLYYENNELILK